MIRSKAVVLGGVGAGALLLSLALWIGGSRAPGVRSGLSPGPGAEAGGGLQDVPGGSDVGGPQWTEDTRDAPLEAEHSGVPEEGVPWDNGHPDYGRYPGMAAILHEAAISVMPYAGGRSRLLGDEWVEAQTRWTVRRQGQEIEFQHPPLDMLTSGPLTQAQRDQALRIVEGFDDEIRRHAHYAHSLLWDCARDYAENRLQRVPRGSKAASATGSSENRSRYRIGTTIDAGNWSYVIDFQSRECPILESALEALEELRAQRTREVERILR